MTYELPKFLIIGTQRGGTTSLYYYLSKHPRLRPSVRKELHYFNGPFYHWDMEWYARQFPLKNGADIPFEATPFYLYSTCAPVFAGYHLPQETKFIVLLRDPVKRFWSHFSARKSSYNLTLDLGDIDAVPGRCNQRFIFEMGLYCEQLRRWAKSFPRENFLIIQSELFYRDTEATLNEICEFLGVQFESLNLYLKSYPVHDPLAKYKRGLCAKMPSEVEGFFRKAYAQPNRELFELLGKEMKGWI